MIKNDQCVYCKTIYSSEKQKKPPLPQYILLYLTWSAPGEGIFILNKILLSLLCYLLDGITTTLNYEILDFDPDCVFMFDEPWCLESAIEYVHSKRHFITWRRNSYNNTWTIIDDNKLTHNQAFNNTLKHFTLLLFKLCI